MHDAISQHATARRMLQTVEFVMFDAVGTLIYTDPAPADVYHRVGQRFGFGLTVEDVRERFSAAFKKHHLSGPTEESIERQRWRMLIADVFETHPESEVFGVLWEHFSRPQSWKVYPDVAEVFEALQKRQIPIGIASNFDARLTLLCNQLPPLNQVKNVFYSSAVGWSKPAPEFFSAIQRALKIEPAKILLVGDDREKDFAGAINAGWQALLIGRDETNQDGNVIRGLKELLQLLC